MRLQAGVFMVDTRIAAGVVVGLCLLGAVAPGSNAAPQPAHWSVVCGRIVWSGDKIPSPEQINIDRDPQCCLKNGPILSEKWVIDPKRRGVRWVFVWLAPEPGSPALPIHPARQKLKNREHVLEQKGCRYAPHAMAIYEGDTLTVRNRDEVAHNCNCTGDPRVNPGRGLILPPAKSTILEDLRTQRLPIPLHCNIHGWMHGWLMVFDHPYFAVTDEQGQFELAFAPAGVCRLMIWHEGTGWRGGANGKNGAKVTIRPDGVTDLGDWALNP